MRRIFVIFLIFTMVLMVGCTSKKAANPVDAYIMVIDQLYKEDAGLNGNLKYIAIDTSKMVNLTDVSKAGLLKRLESYGFSVLNLTFDELEKQGYIKDLSFEEGIQFIIEDEPINNNVITMKAYKWRSGTGAIGYDELIIEHKNNKWEIIKLGKPWIS